MLESKNTNKKIMIGMCLGVVIFFAVMYIVANVYQGDISKTQETEDFEQTINTRDSEETQSIDETECTEINEDTEEVTSFIPSKEQVLEAREWALEGMNEQEIKRLKENIKVANQQMEGAYIYHNIFKKLEDKEHLYWNYFEQKGDIQIGWDEDGRPVMTYNRFDAANFIALMEEMKESVNNSMLKEDIQYLMDETRLALESHEVVHVNNIYKMLHDMDYFLLRYGIDDVGVFTQDDSMVSTYYGMLSIYPDLDENAATP